MNDDADVGLNSVDVDLIKYKKSYVAFVDVLGFKQLVANSDTTKISIYYSIIKDSIEKLSEILNDFGKIDFQIMSDSIVFSVEPTSTDFNSKLLSLRALCAGIAHLQFYLAMEGIWLRGGISFGEIKFMDSQFVVGPALVSAHAHELKAKYPRVILDPLIVADLGLSKEEFLDQVATPKDSAFEGQDWIFDWRKHNHLPQAYNDHLFVNFAINLNPPFRYAREAAALVIKNWRIEYLNASENFCKYAWLKDYFLTFAIPMDIKKRILET
nr:hypothetical protein CKG001_23440 [Bdellovibrio sp. CKG001]